MNKERLPSASQAEALAENGRRNIVRTLVTIGFNKLLYEPARDFCSAINNSTKKSSGLTAVERVKQIITQKIGI